jgi:hypothetical protein
MITNFGVANENSYHWKDAGFVGTSYQSADSINLGHDVHLVDIVNGIDAKRFFRKGQYQYDQVIHLAMQSVGGGQTIEGLTTIAGRRSLNRCRDVLLGYENATWLHHLTHPPSRLVPIELQQRDSHFILDEYDINLEQYPSSGF